MKVLSLFDGISCARVALDQVGIPVESYFASEIDKYAIQVSKKNWPKTKYIGDVKDLFADNSGKPITISSENAEHIINKALFVLEFKPVDLMIGGSPCQDLSIAKANRKGLAGEKSGLFWEYVRILKQVKPKYFILENVNSMPKEAKQLITETLGVEPVMINAALVSAQNRKRLFWVGKLEGDTYKTVPISQPNDRGIMLKDILLDGETDDVKSLYITASYHKKNEQNFLDPKGKSVTLSALGGGQGAKTGLYVVPVALRNRGQGKQPEYNGTGKANAMTTVQTDSMVETDKVLRKLHPIECERLQGLPDNYTQGVSNSQRYKACGNAFNVDVIAHILSFIK